MSDDYQIYLPVSFQELYVTPGRIKATISRSELMARYELCEDLATQLTDYARTMQFDLGISEDEVLTRCRRGLLTEPSVVTPAEATWVTRRTAELLGWDCPAFDEDEPS
ncbi:hypothetical protein BH09PSE5_BH09PSE5_49480 [soil metagenome]